MELFGLDETVDLDGLYVEWRGLTCSALGWCNGWKIAPWIGDVTSAIVAGSNTV